VSTPPPSSSSTSETSTRRPTTATASSPGDPTSSSASAQSPAPSDELSSSAPDLTPAHPAVLIPGLKRLLIGAKEQKGWFILSFLGAAAFAALQVVTSGVIGDVTQDVVVPAFDSGRPMTGALVGGGLFIVGIAVLRAVTVAMRRVLASATQFELFRTYRERLVQVYARVPLLWHRRQSTGTLLSSVYSDVEATFFAMGPFPFALATIFMLIYATVVVAAIDVVLLLVMLGVVALLIALNITFQRMAAPITIESQRLRAEVAEIASESFDGANVVKALGREDTEDARFGDSTEQLRRNGIRFGYVRGWFDPVIDALPNLGILLVAALGAWRISTGHLTTGELVEVSYLFTLMALPIRSFGWVLGDLSRTVVGGGRVQKILDVTERRSYGTASLPDGPGVLRFQDVSFEYHDDPATLVGGLAGGTTGTPGTEELPDGARRTTALHHVDLLADPTAGSRTVAIVGPTGSGKSTLTLLASRLIDPTGGHISLDETPLEDLTAQALTADVALVLQQAFVFDDTVRGNITLGEDIDEDTVWWALRIAQADGFVRSLPGGLDTELGERGGTLSGGQRQRIALARALARRPRLLILDDATSACDPSVELAILDGIRTEMTSSTLLLVAYRKSTISLADTVCFLQEGHVIAQGPHDRLRVEVPAYRALVDAYEEAAIADALLEGEDRDDEDRDDEHRDDEDCGGRESAADSDEKEAAR
jgi:ATP-binding cassette subfamily B protein